MKTILAAACAVLSIGCGSAQPKSPSSLPTPRPASAPCAVPAHMGCALPQRFGLGKPTAQSGAQGVDVSLWQGYVSWGTAKANGLRFAIDKAVEAGGRDPRFAQNWVAQRQLGIPHAAYAFMRCCSGYWQGAALAYAIRAVGGMDANALPPVLDTETNGSYGTVCEAARAIRAILHISSVVVYTSPGLWPGGATCGTYLWTAAWGGFPANASSWSSHVAWQWCGTCSFPGVSGQVDRDLSTGLLSFLRPAPPTHGELQRQLYAAYRTRTGLRHRINVLRVLIRVHQCAPGDHRHATPKGYRHACNVHLASGQTAHVQGAAVNRLISNLHARGVW
jgi:GH25 family lysozyme M1 (1,4-beta-N-acetylmuramidase)